jgi:hypothetical protein
MSVYPNPAGGEYYVNLSDGYNLGQLSIEVYNLLGETIFNTKIQNSLTNIDLTHQPDGIYILSVKGINQVLNQRIIKQ